MIDAKIIHGFEGEINGFQVYSEEYFYVLQELLEILVSILSETYSENEFEDVIQKPSFISLLKDYLENNYLGSLESHSGEIYEQFKTDIRDIVDDMNAFDEEEFIDRMCNLF